MAALHGSSPRTWGTQGAARHRAGGIRFIPTHVGNTVKVELVVSREPVHPHARGEHGCTEPAGMSIDGSSPRTWGTLRNADSRKHGSRFIPTHVGNTWALLSASMRKTVHPHARGEHSSLTGRTVTTGGSSPRTWGTLFCRSCGSGFPRFIPTHVGNTTTVSARSAASTVHPHARGEHCNAGEILLQSPGSSPRTWGTQPAELGAPAHRRFIPTHVGNTRQNRALHIHNAVHPHARGEHTNPNSLISHRFSTGHPATDFLGWF